MPETFPSASYPHASRPLAAVGFVIGPMLAGELQAVSALLREVFAASLAPASSRGATAHFWRYTSPEALYARQKAEHWVLIARLPAAGPEPGLPLGMIELRRPGHVVLLGVHPAWQRRGIGRQLVRQATRRCRQAQPELPELTVNAEPAAVRAYLRLGFKAYEPPNPDAAFVPMALALGPGQARV